MRVVHVDAHEFGDVSVERAAFEAAFDDLAFEVVEAGADGLAAAVGEADALLTHYTPIDAAAMDAIAPSVIVRYATGYDGIDLEAATARGIRVTNVPTYCDDEVADHVVALALGLARGLPQYGADVARGRWDWKVVSPRRRFADHAFGLLGFGRKARPVAERARALGCAVLAHDPHMGPQDIAAHGAEPVGLEDLFRRADIISLHVPLTADTAGIVDARLLSLVRAGTILINTARGGVIDEAALADALDAGRLGGAGLDVLAQEPPAADHPLLGRDNVIVTPHAAWYSEEAARRVRELGSRYGIAALKGELSEGLVNPGALDAR